MLKYIFYWESTVTMKLLGKLTAFTLCVSALLIGCGREMKQPIMQVVTPSESPSEKARAAMERVNEKTSKGLRKCRRNGQFFYCVFTASEDIFKEELGFRKGFWVDLVEIYRQENFENASMLEGLENLQDAFAKKLEAGTLGLFYFTYISSFDDIITEYLRLSFEFPEKHELETPPRYSENLWGTEKSLFYFLREPFAVCKKSYQYNVLLRAAIFSQRV